ncbi:hypothetical protein IG631_23466 [Alternaria alternata]|nr:hypothetical protein IG631_23466 [Alternaria alternata]
MPLAKAVSKRDTTLSGPARAVPGKSYKSSSLRRNNGVERQAKMSNGPQLAALHINRGARFGIQSTVGRKGTYGKEDGGRLSDGDLTHDCLFFLGYWYLGRVLIPVEATFWPPDGLQVCQSIALFPDLYWLLSFGLLIRASGPVSRLVVGKVGSKETAWTHAVLYQKGYFANVFGIMLRRYILELSRGVISYTK